MNSQINSGPDEWNQTSHPMIKDAYGSFTILLPSNAGQPAIPHNSKIKVSLPLDSHLNADLTLA